MKAKESDSWGKGLLLYCERRKATEKRGIYTRFLPTLIKDQPVTGTSFSMTGRSRLRKHKINDDIMGVIRQWLDYCVKKISVYDRMVLQFLMALTSGSFKGKKALVGDIITQYKI